MTNLSAEKIETLEKFGFRVGSGMIAHKKLDVELNVEQVDQCSSLNELESFIKEALRSS